MDRSEVFAKFSDIVRALFDEYEGPVTPELNASQVEQWDSLANVQLMVMVEQSFKIRFSTGDISKLQNLDDLASLVMKKTGA
jgi:acyl carrier protein